MRPTGVARASAAASACRRLTREATEFARRIARDPMGIDPYDWNGFRDIVEEASFLVDVLFGGEVHVEELLVPLLTRFTSLERDELIEVVPGIDRRCTCILRLLQCAARAKEDHARDVYEQLKRHGAMRCLLEHLDVEDELLEGRRRHEAQLLRDGEGHHHQETLRLEQLGKKRMHAVRLIQLLIGDPSDDGRRRKELSRNRDLRRCLRECALPEARFALEALEQSAA